MAIQKPKLSYIVGFTCIPPKRKKILERGRKFFFAKQDTKGSPATTAAAAAQRSAARPAPRLYFIIGRTAKNVSSPGRKKSEEEAEDKPAAYPGARVGYARAYPAVNI